MTRLSEVGVIPILGYLGCSENLEKLGLNTPNHKLEHMKSNLSFKISNSMIHIKQGFTQLAEIELNQELNSISFLVFLAL